MYFVTCNIPDIVCPGQRKGESLGQSVLGEFFGQIWVSFMFIYALSDYVKGRSECIGGVFWSEVGGEYLGQPKFGWCQVFTAQLSFSLGKGFP